MPRDLITAETYAERVGKLRAALATAGDEYDEAVMKAETGNGDELAVKNAHANVQSIRDRIAALGRARALSSITEDENREKQLKAERRAEIAQVHRNVEETRVALKAFSDAVTSAIEHGAIYNEKYEQVANSLLSVVGEGSHAMVSMALSHRYEGANIVAQLQACGMPGLDHLEEMSPTEAMRQFGGQDLTQMVWPRIRSVLLKARVDLTVHEAESELEAESRLTAEVE